MAVSFAIRWSLELVSVPSLSRLTRGRPFPFGACRGPALTSGDPWSRVAAARPCGSFPGKGTSSPRVGLKRRHDRPDRRQVDDRLCPGRRERPADPRRTVGTPGVRLPGPHAGIAGGSGGPVPGHVHEADQGGRPLPAGGEVPELALPHRRQPGPQPLAPAQDPALAAADGRSRQHRRRRAGRRSTNLAGQESPGSSFRRPWPGCPNASARPWSSSSIRT